LSRRNIAAGFKPVEEWLRVYVSEDSGVAVKVVVCVEDHRKE